MTLIIDIGSIPAQLLPLSNNAGLVLILKSEKLILIYLEGFHSLLFLLARYLPCTDTVGLVKPYIVYIITMGISLLNFFNFFIHKNLPKPLKMDTLNPTAVH